VLLFLRDLKGLDKARTPRVHGAPSVLLSFGVVVLVGALFAFSIAQPLRSNAESTAHSATSLIVGTWKCSRSDAHSHRPFVVMNTYLRSGYVQVSSSRGSERIPFTFSDNMLVLHFDEGTSTSRINWKGANKFTSTDASVSSLSSTQICSRE
jgi:hypothetical protein